MSAGGAFGGARGYQPRPPEKGVFPLDHFGECKSVKDAYLACLKTNGESAEPCRSLSKQYLECRMERNLMARQDLKELGFRENNTPGSIKKEPSGKEETIDWEARKQKGFVAGIKR